MTGGRRLWQLRRRRTEEVNVLELRRRSFANQPWRTYSRAAVLCVLAAALATGCVYHEPVPAYRSRPSNFDRSWEAARAAAADVGVTITDVDRARGTMLGYYGASQVTITAWQQADGSVRVGFKVRAPNGPDAELADHLSEAFGRRMRY
jgi:hypothetical protein